MATATQATIRLHITTIAIELKKPPKYPIYAGIFINGERVYKLPPIAEDLPLRWSVDLPIDVAPQSQVTLQVKEFHRVRVWQGDLGTCRLSYHPDWLKYDSAGAQKEIVQQAEKITISVKFSPPLGIKDAQVIADRATEATNDDSILGKLGQARFAVETIMSVLEYVEEVHPIAKAALSTLTKAYKFLEEEGKYDESLSDLALGMADMLSFAETVNQHVKIVQLKDTIAQMLLLVEDASRFIVDSQSNSAIGRAAIGLVSSKRRNKIDGYVKDFQTLRSGFDRGVTVQILDFSSQVLKVVGAAEERSLREQERLLLKELPRAHSAGYDPSACCMEGTRTQILQDIINWTTQPTGSTFLWLHGPAGSGKSSVASSTARELQRRNLLGATFFCSRDQPELRDPVFVLPTIAVRLAVVFLDYGKAVADQLRHDPDIGRSAIQFQYEGLFASPLKKIEGATSSSRPASLIIIIDALDECGNPKIRATLLEYLLKISHLTDWLKVIATSRPEPDIARILGSNPFSTSFPLLLNDNTAYNDILLFTQTRMAEVRETKDLQPLDWPGEVRIHRLAEMAGGLFIWAETAYKFIASSYIPEERLTQLLSKASTPSIYSKVDTLYSTTLGVAFEEFDSDNIEIFKLVVGTIVTALAPLPVRGLFYLLGGRIPETGIWGVVNSFRSVLYEDEQNDSVIRVCHLSFVDFITDSSRCPQFYVDVRQHHTALTIVSLQIMQDRLRFNICDLESSEVFNDQIPDLGRRVENAISIPLIYSCVHWMTHLHNSFKDVALVEALERFLTQKTVLYWIEALSLLGEIPAAIHGLPLAVSWLQDAENPSTQVISDIYRFVLAFREPITRSTPHLYISALPFAPTQSLISRRFLSSFPNTISLDNRDSFWSPCLQTLDGHRDQVRGVSWSPDGQRLASSSLDSSICVWDSTTGALVQRLPSHSTNVSAVSFSPNNRLIASGSDKKIQMWDADTGALIPAPFLGHSNSIYRIIFSPDGEHLASCSKDETICIWDIATGKLVLDPFNGHSDQVWGIAYSSEGAHIVSCSSDKTVRVWDVKTGRTTLGPLAAHRDEVFTVEFSPDGFQIVSGSRDGSFIIWDSTSGAILLGPLQVGATVFFAKFSPDGRLILSTSGDSKIRIWNAESGAELFNQEHSGFILSASFSPDGQHFVTGSSDQTVRIWELSSLRPATSSVSDSWHTSTVYSVAVSPDGKYIVSGSRDETVRVWHADTGRSACAPLRGHGDRVTSVDFSSDSRYILSASGDKTLRLWAVGTWESAMKPFAGHTGTITCALFSPDGHVVMSGSQDHTIRLWNPATGKEISEPLRGHQAAVITLDLSSDGRLIGSGSTDESLMIWDSVTRLKISNFSLPHRSGEVQSIKFSPDAQYIASRSNGGYLWLWDVQKQTLLWKCDFLSGSGRGCCTFSLNGRHIFCSSISLIYTLDATTGLTVRVPFRGHNTTIHSLAISPIGKQLVSSSADSTIRAWDIEYEEEEIREELLPDAQNLLGPVGQDGWVRLQTGEPLLWIPAEYRDGLWKRALYSIPPTTQNHPRTLDCSRFRHGNAWTEVQSI